MSLVVLCAGGHARVVIEALRSRGARPTAATDRDLARVGSFLGGIPIIGSDFTTVCVREHSVTVPFGVVDFDDHRRLGIREKPKQKFFVNAGVYLLDPGVLDHLSPDVAVAMPSLIETTIAQGKTSVVFPLREYWIDVGRLDDLQRASDEFHRIFG